MKYDLRKYCFTNHEVNMWNSVPDWVVSAHYTNIFENRLNHYWQHQDLQHIVYDFQAHIQGMETEVNFV